MEGGGEEGEALLPGLALLESRELTCGVTQLLLPPPGVEKQGQSLGRLSLDGKGKITRRKNPWRLHPSPSFLPGVGCESWSCSSYTGTVRQHPSHTLMVVERRGGDCLVLNGITECLTPRPPFLVMFTVIATKCTFKRYPKSHGK